MTGIPTVTYVLDGIGAFGVIVGSYVASKSVYSSRVGKEATSLIALQDRKISTLDQTIKDLTKEVHKYREDNNKMMGELTAYKKMVLVNPEIIAKLTSTLDNILATLVKDGIHVDTQRIDTQVIKEAKTVKK